ncbi:MAG: glycoside hydrolase, partial [Dysgonamonadaceae bacterium]|nr:glycoside hydrolase [Dysgonamonadaceae bacterium]
MNKITLLCSVIAFSFVATAQTTDYYTAAQRAEWLQKSEAAKPPLIATDKKPVGIVKIVEDTTAYQGWKTEKSFDIDEFYKKSLRDQSGIVLDFGEHLTGYVRFAVTPIDKTPDAPARIKFTFGEVPAEIATPFDPYPGGLSRAWLQDETVTVMLVPDTITIPRRLSFRYVKIELVGAPSYPFAISAIHCDALTSVATVAEPLAPATPTLFREIDRVGLATLKECMQSVYEDGPKRDQRLWIGDLYLEALANAYSFKNHLLTKRCFYLLAALADESGFLNACVFEKPTPHPQAKQ